MAVDTHQLEIAQYLFDKYTKKGHKDHNGGWVIQLQWDKIGEDIIGRFVQSNNTEEERRFLSELIDEDEKRKSEKSLGEVSHCHSTIPGQGEHGR